MNSENKKQKVSINGVGWKTVKLIYLRRKLWFSIGLPIFLSLMFSIYAQCSLDNIIDIIQFTANLIIQILPGVLGFILAGYALMMGLSSSDYIKKLKQHKDQNYDHSMFQTLNATFAFVLFMLFSTLIFGVITLIIIKLGCIYIAIIPQRLGYFINWAYLTFILFLLFYSILSIKDIVINVFNFGQFVQAYKETKSPRGRKKQKDVIEQKQAE